MQDFWSPLQKIMRDICSNFDKTWQIRKRVIDTQLLVLFIFKLVLSKNRQGYKSLLNELWEHAELAVCQQQQPLSASSLCEARQKLPETIFIELNKAVLSYQADFITQASWCGHRIFAADGSKINLPRELLLEGYRAPNKDQYYPQGLMSVIYHVGSGLIQDCLLSTDSERHCVISQLDTLAKGDVLVLDRGYFSYLVLYQASEKNIHLICRLQSGTMNKAVESFWRSHLNDAVIDYTPSAAVKSEIKKQGYHLNYKPIKLRLIKYKIEDEVYVCATTLIGEHYPLDEFPRVYHGRWGIEELYKISKEFMEVEDFHAKSERGVKQELYAHAVLINIARLFESEANKQLPPSSSNRDEAKTSTIKGSHWQGLFDTIQKIKINFKNCLLVISRFIEKLIIALVDKKEGWLSKMLASISRVRQKIRPGRHFPRRSRKPYTKWKSSNASKLVKA
jgi:Transposase DDE domain/Insertion element 4 transposase N-terminal